MIRLGDLSYEEFDAQHRLGPCIWPHFDLLYVCVGRLEMQVGATKLNLESGYALLIHPQTSYAGFSLTPRTKAAALYFSVTDDDRGAHSDEPPAVFGRLTHKRKGFELHDCRHWPSVEQDIDRLISLSHALPSPSLHDMRLALLTLILGQLHPQPPLLQDDAGGGGEFHTLIWWLHNNLYRSITLDEMARFVELSPSHFRARFQRAVGQSPGSFLLALRMQKARQLLVETDEPIKSIGQDVGYSDLPHFYRAFKQNCSATPNQWRARHTRSGEGKWRKLLPSSALQE